ncbi:MAG: diaminopimelate epimerase [Bacteroidota bacterium]
MKIDFCKYQGTGNDFIIIDNRKENFPKSNTELVQNLCHRKFGIGADGFMLLENSEEYDFKMVYFNADGEEGTMCGNGGRCLVAFAKKLGIFDQKTTFEAIDGIHHAKIEENVVSLQMLDVNELKEYKDHIFLDTGSPHHVEFHEDISKLDVFKKGKEIRYGSPYFEAGTNVNFVQQVSPNTFKVRTYERGVENETLSCGTGVTAVAIASFFLNKTANELIKLKTLGGDLEVSFDKVNDNFENVILKGPATFVFSGTIGI